MDINKIYIGDVIKILKTFPDECVDMIMTSPPYWGLRDYSIESQIGLEPTLNEYLDKMLSVTTELKRVLKKRGTLWWNHGDSYGTGSGAGSKNGSKQATNRAFSDENLYYIKKGKKSIPGYEKSLLLQAHRLAIRMIDEQSWILRNQIIWYKPNAMPSSVKDRFTVDFEPIFFFSKSKQYYFEPQYEQYTEPMNRWGGDKLVANGQSTWDEGTGQDTYRDRDMRPNGLGRNKRTVWKIPTQPLADAHFASFPENLVITPIKAGCPEKGIVLDPFIGSGTVGKVALDLGRNYIGIELNPDYIKLANKRIGIRLF